MEDGPDGAWKNESGMRWKGEMRKSEDRGDVRTGKDRGREGALQLCCSGRGGVR